MDGKEYVRPGRPYPQCVFQCVFQLCTYSVYLQCVPTVCVSVCVSVCMCARHGWYILCGTRTWPSRR